MIAQGTVVFDTKEAVGGGGGWQTLNISSQGTRTVEDIYELLSA